MSHVEAIVEPDVKSVQARRARWCWWLLITLTAAVAIVVWLRSGRLDSRLFGEWTFVTTDGRGVRSFLTLNGNGTARVERAGRGSIERVSDSGLMNWWMEGDILVAEPVVDPLTRAHQMAADAITLVRRRPREDRSAFRLKVIHVDERTLRISEGYNPAVPPLEVEMTRVEDSN